MSPATHLLISTARDAEHIQRIVQHGRILRTFLAGTIPEQLAVSTQTHDAIGYAVLKVLKPTRWLSDEFRTTHPEIEWQKLRAIRSQWTTDFADVTPHEVWEVATSLVDLLEPLAPPLEEP